MRVNFKLLSQSKTNDQPVWTGKFETGSFVPNSVNYGYNEAKRGMRGSVVEYLHSEPQVLGLCLGRAFE